MNYLGYKDGVLIYGTPYGCVLYARRLYIESAVLFGTALCPTRNWAFLEK